MIKIDTTKYPEKIWKYIPIIQEYMKDCFDVENYDLFSPYTWYFTLNQKKENIGFIAVDPHNTIWNVCVSPKYRGHKAARAAINAAVRKICKSGGLPRLYVDAGGKRYEKLVEYYTELGFEPGELEDDSLEMSHNCKN